MITPSLSLSYFTTISVFLVLKANMIYKVDPDVQHLDEDDAAPELPVGDGQACELVETRHLLASAAFSNLGVTTLRVRQKGSLWNHQNRRSKVTLNVALELCSPLPPTRRKCIACNGSRTGMKLICMTKI